MYNTIPYAFTNPGLTNAGMIGNGLLKSSIFSRINWSSLLSNTQKTLNVVNQAIPLYYQVKPVFNNIKTIGKIGKEMTRLNTTKTPSNNVNITKEVNSADLPTPTFFI